MSDLKSNRIEWIDFCKGLLMLLVIFSHCLGGQSIVGEAARGAIFSFHMPMFFMLSCITFRYSASSDEWRAKTLKAFKHLIIPALIMYAHKIIGELILGYGSDSQFVLKKLLSLLFASGILYDLKNITVPEIGVFWFVYALFIGRSLYDLLRCRNSGRYFYLKAAAVSIAGIIIGQFVQLPFSADVAMAVFPFFYMGDKFSALKLNEHKRRNIIICIAVWIADMLLSYIIMHGYFELACRRYTLFPLCYLGAAAGIILMYYFCEYVCSFKKLIGPIVYIGRYSMVMLSVHCMDFMWEMVWKAPGNEFACAIVRTVIDIAVFAVIMLIKNKLKRPEAIK